LKEKFQKNHKIILKHNVINKQVIDCWEKIRHLCI
jgi:hypothetical protein